MPAPSASIPPFETAAEDICTRFQRSIEAAWSTGDLDLLDDVYHVGYIRHQMGYDDLEGLEALKAYIVDTRSQYPDLHLAFEDFIFEADTLSALITWQGTQRSQTQTADAPPAGRKVRVTLIAKTYFVDGFAVEEWIESWDVKWCRLPCEFLEQDATEAATEI